MSDTQVYFENLLPVEESSKEKSEKKRTTSNSTRKIKNSSVTNTKKTKSSSSVKPKTDNKKNIKKATTAKVAAKNTTRKKTAIKGRNTKINVTQEDMDKLCEVYDWYLQVKDLDFVKSPVNSKISNITIDEDIIKNKKRISSVVDEEIWDDFDRLCGNTNYNKGEILTQAIKEFLQKHKDII